MKKLLNIRLLLSRDITTVEQFCKQSHFNSIMYIIKNESLNVLLKAKFENHSTYSVIFYVNIFVKAQRFYGDKIVKTIILYSHTKIRVN